MKDINFSAAKRSSNVGASQSTNFEGIDKKWQKEWEKAKVFEAKEDTKKEKYYALEMYAYPSASGLHIGHAFQFTVGDILARYMRMKGKSVLYPTGYDSFGLPAENAAIKEGVHPQKYTDTTIKHFIQQQKALGLSYDWSRILWSHNPEYYKWNQYFFLQFLKNGLAYRKNSPVNWCSKCESVLANEQVHDGKCWRHGDTSVVVKQLEQWFVKTTKYAEELLRDVDKLDWPERIKSMQKNWIGKSEGAEIDFEIASDKKTNFVLLHGYTGSSEANFFPWLKNNLETRGYKVDTPNLPNTNNPDIMEQVNYVLKNCEFNENTVLLGHSLGCVIALKVLEKLNNPIRKFISVAGFNKPGFKDKIRPFEKTFDGKFDFQKIKGNIKEIIILRAENDCVVPKERADSLKEKIGGIIIDFRAEDNHACGNMEPEVLNACVEKWPVFTTRADTLFGVTFLVVSAQHSKLDSLVTAGQKKEVSAFLKKIKSTKQEDFDKMEKEGVFTGSYAVHPLTGEKIPIWVGNFVVADYGSGMVMGVPAHDERDFAFAVKYNISIKEVIAPMFLTEKGPDTLREDKPIIERNAVFAIVKHWKEDKYFCLNWETFNWKSFVLGGVEKGETFEEAALREVKEETGYLDIKSVKQIGFEIHSKFFASHKNVNRYAKQRCFLVELGSDKFSKPLEEHTKNHKGLWIEKKSVSNFLNLQNNQFYWNTYLNGESAYTDSGILINSGAFDGLDSDEAKEHIVIALNEKKLGRKIIQYKLRDWLISRQRYWGTPIPIVYCDKCGIVPVPEKDLPVKLPEKVKFGKGNPLETATEWVNTKCPKCKGKARRETDTMDTFMDSSWYYLRYTDSSNSKKPFDQKKAEYWAPIDQYIGGAEHATMHLIYARFFTKALRDLGMLKINEPFNRLFNQGMLHKDGFVMSKSRGNVVSPEEVSKKYGIDTARLFLMSIASPDKDTEWTDTGIEGSYRFVLRVMNYINNFKTGKSSPKVEHKVNKTIQKVTSEIRDLRYNNAVINLRALFEVFESEPGIARKDLESFLKMFGLFCPHISEELWAKLGKKGFVSVESWPVVDESKIDERFDKAEDALDKVVSDILNILKIVKEKTGKESEKVYIYVIPNEKEFYNSEALSVRVGKNVEVYAVNDKGKYDPQGKAGKTKPGKPGIYVE